MASVTGCVADSCEAERLVQAARPVSISQCQKHTSAVQAEPGVWARPNTYVYKYICSATASFWCSARPMKNCPSFNPRNKHILWLPHTSIFSSLLHWHLFRYRSKFRWSCTYTVHHLEVTQSLSQNWRSVPQHSWGTRWLRCPIAGRPGSGHQILQLLAIPCWERLLSPLNNTRYKINITHILCAPQLL